VEDISVDRFFARAAAIAAIIAAPFSVTVANAEPRPVVVELFTSEGCSSCPPADAFVGKLSGQPQVLALSFHVDYWDSPGWQDRFALHQAVQRQNVYAQVLHRSTVYTPQIVIDGREDYFNSHGESVARALSGPRDGVPVAISTRDSQVVIDLGAYPSKPSDVVLVAYLRHAISSVGGGENAGRTLEEFNIVRYIKTLGQSNGQVQSFQVPLSSLPSDATDVAVLVQPRGQAPIVGAATYALR
jgi:hypothetical protein